MKSPGRLEQAGLQVVADPCDPAAPSGDMLRSAVLEGTADGQQAAAIMARHEFVPDQLVVD